MPDTATNAGEWHDLSVLAHAGMPYPSYFPPPCFEPVSEADGYGTPAVTRFTLCSHMGTHVDSPAHFVPGGRALDEFPLERFIVPAAVWAIERGPGKTIEVDDLANAAPAVTPGEAVLLATGWGARWGTDGYRHHPYLSESAATWLVEQGVGLLGLDLMTPDRPVALRPPGFAFPVHHILLRADVLIIENLVGLDGLAGRKVELHALPMRLDIADGAPVRAVARTRS